MAETLDSIKRSPYPGKQVAPADLGTSPMKQEHLDQLLADILADLDRK